MKFVGLFAAAGILAQIGTFAGSVEGSVRAEGKEGAESKPGAGGAYESRKFKFATTVDYSKMRDFIVYLEGDFKEKPVPPSKPVQIVTQKDASFKPHVLPILVGTTVEWPNQDEILHNVFSDSDAKKFDLGLYKNEIKRVTFDKPGKVDVFCSIHSQMHCVVMALQTPFFATTDDKNHFSIKDVPPGKYTLKVWHERMPLWAQEIEVPAAEAPLKVNVVVGIKGLPKY